MAWAHVQSTSKSQAPTALTIEQAFASNVGAGRGLIAFVAWAGQTITCSVADPLNGAWTAIGTPRNFSTTHRCQLFYLKNSAAGATTPQATFSSTTTDRWLYIHEYSGLDTTAPLDQNTSNGGTSAAPNSGNVVTGAANVLVFGAALCGGTGSAGAGFTARQTLDGHVTEDKDGGASTSTVSAAFTMAPSSDWAALVATFKAAGGTSATVTAVTAAGTGDLVTPAVSAGSSPTAPTAAGTGTVPVPGITATGDATVLAVPCAGTGGVPAPTLSAGATVTALPMAATGSIAANIPVSSQVVAALMAATGGVPAPAVSGTGSATVTAVPMAATGDVVTPTVSAGATLTALPAAGTGALVLPAVSASSNVTAVPGAATGDLLAATVTGSIGGGSQFDHPPCTQATLDVPVSFARLDAPVSAVALTAPSSGAVVVAPVSAVALTAPSSAAVVDSRDAMATIDRPSSAATVDGCA